MENQYTSLELSKKLKEVGFENEYKYDDEQLWWFHWWEGSSDDRAGEDILQQYEYNHDSVMPLYPAYDLLWDLCVRYKEEVWGKETKYCTTCQERHKGYIFHGDETLYLLQQGKKDEAEQYILDNSILFKDHEKQNG